MVPAVDRFRPVKAIISTATGTHPSGCVGGKVNGRHIFLLKKRILLLKRKKRYTFAQKVSFGVLSKSIPLFRVSFAQKYVVEIL